MQFSNLAMNLKASEIRELLKLTTMPEIISSLAACRLRNCSRQKISKKLTKLYCPKKARLPCSTARPKGTRPFANKSQAA